MPGINWYVVVLVHADVQLTSLESDNPLYNVVVAVSSIALIISTFSLITVIYYRKTRLFRLTQPILIMFVLLGCILLCIHCFALLGPNTSTVCGVRPYLFNLAYTFTFAQFFIKATRIYDIFIVNPMQKNKTIRTPRLIGKAMYLVLFDLLIIVSTLYSSTGTSPMTTTEIESNGAYAVVKYCAYIRNNSLLTAEIAYKSILMFITCVVSFRIRNVPGSLAGSKVLLIIVYNTAFISVVVILITRLTAGNIPLTILIEVCGIAFCCVVNAGLLVLPLLFQLLTIGDDAAVEEVMDELFHNKIQGSKDKDRMKQMSTSKVSNDILSKTLPFEGQNLSKSESDMRSQKDRDRERERDNGREKCVNGSVCGTKEGGKEGGTEGGKEGGREER